MTTEYQLILDMLKSSRGMFLIIKLLYNSEPIHKSEKVQAAVLECGF